MFFAMIFALPIQWGYHYYLDRKFHKTGDSTSLSLSSSSSLISSRLTLSLSLQ
jgi:hypothetical protein